ncbi:MAG: hypothetical protein WCO84_03520 [bacterium]
MRKVIKFFGFLSVFLLFAFSRQAFAVPTTDYIPPDTSISSSIDDAGFIVVDNATTSATGINIVFTGTDNISPPYTLSFSCSFDGGAFAPCVSPIAYSGLPLGRHSFSVKATDQAKNTDQSPVVLNWEIVIPPDRTAPDTLIVSSVEGNGVNLASNGSTISNSMVFSFSGMDDRTDSGLLSFVCGLDNAASLPCMPPVSYSGLGLGVHTFTVSAIDQAGNIDATPAIYSWSIIPPPDITPPDTLIVSAIDESGATTTINGSTKSTGINITFAGADDRTATNDLAFSCSIDNGGFSSCVSPKNYSGLAIGTHTFSVVAIDQAGNTDASPSVFQWTIVSDLDVVAPETTIVSVVDQNGGVLNMNQSTNSTGVSISFTGIDDRTSADNLAFSCAIDGGAYSPCTSAKSYSGLALGGHTFSVVATDQVGNVDATPALFYWTITGKCQDPIIQLQSLIALIKSYNYSQDLTKKLTDYPNQAIKSLTDKYNKNDVHLAYVALDNFIKRVDSESKYKNSQITKDKAVLLSKLAEDIKINITCIDSVVSLQNLIKLVISLDLPKDITHKLTQYPYDAIVWLVDKNHKDKPVCYEIDRFIKEVNGILDYKKYHYIRDEDMGCGGKGDYDDRNKKYSDGKNEGGKDSKDGKRGAYGDGSNNKLDTHDKGESGNRDGRNGGYGDNREDNNENGGYYILDKDKASQMIKAAQAIKAEFGCSSSRDIFGNTTSMFAVLSEYLVASLNFFLSIFS